MATKYWTGGTSSTFATAANWSDAAAPADDDIFYIDNVTVAIDGASTGMDNTTTYVGPNMTATIGSSGTPLNMSGTTTGNTIRYNGLRVPSSYWSSGSVAGNTFYVLGTSETANACNIAGTWTNVYVISGNVRITGGTTTNLHLLGTCNVLIDSGATVTNVYQNRGRVESAIAHTLVNVYGGTFFTNVQSAVTLAAVNVYAGATFRFWSRAGVLTALNVNGGLATTVGHESVKTITAGTVRSGGRLECNPGTAGTITRLGGKVSGTGLTVTNTVDEWNGDVGSTGG